MYTEKDRQRRDTWLRVRRQLTSVLDEYRKLDVEGMKAWVEASLINLRETADAQAKLWDDPDNSEVK